MNVNKYSDGKESITSAWNKNGDRLGFVAKDKRDGDTRYGIGIDNMGSPYRGVMDREVSTPFGTVDYGYDGDTVYAGFNKSNNPYYDLLNRLGSYDNGYERGSYANITGSDQVGTSATPYGDAGVYYDRNGQPLLSAGIKAFTDGTRGIGASMAAPVTKDYYNEIDTPLGLIGYGTNAPQNGQPGNVYGDFTPYYIQALANLLNRQR